MVNRKRINKEVASITLTDDYVFKHCMEDSEILKKVLEKLWERDLEDIIEIKKQYHIKPAKDYKSISCDIYARDSKGNIFIVEMQKKPHPGLLKRAEFYQGISVYNECILEKKLSYKAHPRSYIAFLCLFDVTKVYPELDFPEFTRIDKCIYGDETKRFFNINNYVLIEDVELQELFKFILNSDIHLHASWYVVELLQRKVKKMKGENDVFELLEFNEAMIDDYYHEGWYDGEEIGIEKGIEKGLEQGRKEGSDLTNSVIIRRMYEKKFSLDMISSIVGMDIKEIQDIIDRK